jgi:hypothetical protein
MSEIPKRPVLWDDAKVIAHEHSVATRAVEALREMAVSCCDHEDEDPDEYADDCNTCLARAALRDIDASGWEGSHE